MRRRKARERVFLPFPFPSPPAPAARVTRRRLGTSQGCTPKELSFSCHSTLIFQPRLVFYFNTNKSQSIFFGRIPVVLESCRSFFFVGGGGVLTPCTLPLDLPLCSMQLTELVCMEIMTMDSEIPGITSQQGMRIQY